MRVWIFPEQFQCMVVLAMAKPISDVSYCVLMLASHISADFGPREDADTSRRNWRTVSEPAIPAKVEVTVSNSASRSLWQTFRTGEFRLCGTYPAPCVILRSKLWHHSTKQAWLAIQPSHTRGSKVSPSGMTAIKLSHGTLIRVIASVSFGRYHKLLGEDIRPSSYSSSALSSRTKRCVHESHWPEHPCP